MTGVQVGAPSQVEFVCANLREIGGCVRNRASAPSYCPAAMYFCPRPKLQDCSSIPGERDSGMRRSDDLRVVDASEVSRRDRLRWRPRSGCGEHPGFMANCAHSGLTDPPASRKAKSKEARKVKGRRRSDRVYRGNLDAINHSGGSRLVAIASSRRGPVRGQLRPTIPAPEQVVDPLRL
jgi:hypothetical protein